MMHLHSSECAQHLAHDALRCSKLVEPDDQVRVQGWLSTTLA